LSIIRKISIGLSGPDKQDGNDGGEQADVDKFESRFGWLIHAERFAAHYRVSLNEAFELPCREFVNSIVYLKGKEEWEKRRNKQWQ
jgi:hypothetical protein